MAIDKIDEDAPEADRYDRFRYFSRFVGFTDPDIEPIHAAAGLLIPILPGVEVSFPKRSIDHEATLRFFASGSDWASVLDTAEVPRPDLNLPHFQRIRGSLIRFLEELFGGDRRSPALFGVWTKSEEPCERWSARFQIHQLSAQRDDGVSVGSPVVESPFVGASARTRNRLDQAP